MARWLLANWKTIALVVAAVAVVGSVARAAHWRGVYEAETDLADRQSERIGDLLDSVATSREDRARDSTALAALRDSSEARSDSLRATSTALRRTRDSLSVVRTLRLATADSLEAEALDEANSLGRVAADLFRAYVVSVRGALAAVDSALAAETERADTEAARADEEERLAAEERTAAERLREDLDRSARAIALLEARDSTRLRQIEAAENAADFGGGFFSGVLDDALLVGAGCGAATLVASAEDRLVVGAVCLGGSLLAKAVRP